jgi:hypothetical protein
MWLSVIVTNRVVIVGHADLQGHSCFSDLSGRYGLEEWVREWQVTFRRLVPKKV